MQWGNCKLKLKNIFIAIVLLLLFQACAFVGAGAIGTVNYTGDDMRRSQLYYVIPQKDLSVTNRNWREARYNKNDIQMKWGEPDIITVINEHSEAWTYKKGLRWKGIIILALIPVPVAFPVGRMSIIFTFEDNLLSYYSIIDDHWCLSYAGLNLIPLDPGGGSKLGFTAGTICQWHKGGIGPTYGKMICDLPFYGCYPSQN